MWFHNNSRARKKPDSFLLKQHQLMAFPIQRETTWNADNTSCQLYPDLFEVPAIHKKEKQFKPLSLIDTWKFCVAPMGFEPMTSVMQVKCSTNWAFFCMEQSFGRALHRQLLVSAKYKDHFSPSATADYYKGNGIMLQLDLQFFNWKVFLNKQ